MVSSFLRDELSLPAPSDNALWKHRGNCSLSGFSHSTVETAYRVEKTVTSVEIKRPFCIKFKERFLQELRLHLSSWALRKSHSGLSAPEKPLQPRCQIYKQDFYVLCWTEEQNFIFKDRENVLGPMVLVITDFSIRLSPL